MYGAANEPRARCINRCADDGLSTFDPVLSEASRCPSSLPPRRSRTPSRKRQPNPHRSPKPSPPRSRPAAGAGTPALWDPWHCIHNGKGLIECAPDAVYSLALNEAVTMGLGPQDATGTLLDRFPYLSEPIKNG